MNIIKIEAYLKNQSTFVQSHTDFVVKQVIKANLSYLFGSGSITPLPA
jgi:hypothetical protein